MSRRPVLLPVCLLAFTHQFNTHQSFQAYGCFSTYTVTCSPLVEDERRLSNWLLSIVGKTVWNHNSLIEITSRYRLKSEIIIWKFCHLTNFQMQPDSLSTNQYDLDSSVEGHRRNISVKLSLTQTSRLKGKVLKVFVILTLFWCRLFFPTNQ